MVEVAYLGIYCELVRNTQFSILAGLLYGYIKLIENRDMVRLNREIVVLGGYRKIYISLHLLQTLL